ncbi:HpcH/HpaI aldolase/citrate lyase family protein [Thermodesulfobacteriota bacterium]
MTKIRRSLLFVPADRPERVAKAATLPTDVIVIELEDGVAPKNKDLARREAGRVISEIDFGHREVALRVNKLSTLCGLADIQAIAGWQRKPDLIMLPKVESCGEVRLYDELLTEMKADSELMLLVETSLGLQAAAEMVTATPRVSAISFAIADLPAELGCRPAWEPMFAIRAAIVTTAGLGSIMPIDPPYLNIKDEAGLKQECKRVRDMGYVGKICIHPSQLEAVNQTFSPTLREIKRAQKIVEAVSSQGGGAVMVDGRMVDPPGVKIAQRVIETARRLGTD